MCCYSQRSLFNEPGIQAGRVLHADKPRAQPTAVTGPAQALRDKSLTRRVKRQFKHVFFNSDTIFHFFPFYPTNTTLCVRPSVRLFVRPSVTNL